jgi:hypothetical protein
MLEEWRNDRCGEAIATFTVAKRLKEGLHGSPIFQVSRLD